MGFVILSHLVNVIVVTIIPLLIARDTMAMRRVYGGDTPARRILACLYATIALASAIGLVSLMLTGSARLAIVIAAILFPMQIAYKLATVVAVGLRNPVVVSNLAIAVLHATTLTVAAQGGLFDGVMLLNR